MFLLFLFEYSKDDSSASGEDRPVYKKVAVVEDFFDIIYREHVEFMNNSGGRPSTGKHAGQKRTYRAVKIIFFQVLRIEESKSNWLA